MKTLYNDTIAVDETVSIDYEMDRDPIHGDKLVYFLNGGATGVSLTLAWYVRPESDAEFYHTRGFDENNIDLSTGERFDPDTDGAAEVRCDVTNTGNDPIEFKLSVQEVWGGQ